MMRRAQSTNSTMMMSLFFPLLAASVLAGGKSPAQSQKSAIVSAKLVGDNIPSSNFASSIPAEEATHVVVGRSIFVNTKHRLTRIYITNPAVLDSYTASPNQILVTAKEPGVSSLILWDEAGESQAYLISSDINVEKLQIGRAHV